MAATTQVYFVEGKKETGSSPGCLLDLALSHAQVRRIGLLLVSLLCVFDVLKPDTQVKVPDFARGHN